MGWTVVGTREHDKKKRRQFSNIRKEQSMKTVGGLYKRYSLNRNALNI